MIFLLVLLSTVAKAQVTCSCSCCVPWPCTPTNQGTFSVSSCSSCTSVECASRFGFCSTLSGADGRNNIPVCSSGGTSVGPTQPPSSSGASATSTTPSQAQWVMFGFYSDASCSTLVGFQASQTGCSSPNQCNQQQKQTCQSSAPTTLPSSFSQVTYSGGGSCSSGTLSSIFSAALNTCIPNLSTGRSSLYSCNGSATILTSFSASSTCQGASSSSVLPASGCSGGILTSSSCSSSSSGNVCFHRSTEITYKGRVLDMATVQRGEHADCVIPHTVVTSGVRISTTCSQKTLRLTRDHLVFTHGGKLVSAGQLQVSDSIFDAEDRPCIITRIEADLTDEYFGLNCIESVVLANGYKTSTFGFVHRLPSLWMYYSSKLLGLQRASRMGDVIASAWHWFASN